MSEFTNPPLPDPASLNQIGLAGEVRPHTAEANSAVPELNFTHILADRLRSASISDSENSILSQPSLRKFQVHLQDLREAHAEVPRLDRHSALTASREQIDTMITGYSKFEEAIGAFLKNVRALAADLKKEEIDPIHERYSHCTGFMDSPKTNGALSATIGTTTLIAAGVGIFGYGHPVLSHICHRLAEVSSHIAGPVGMWNAVWHAPVYFGAFLGMSAAGEGATHLWGAARIALGKLRSHARGDVHLYEETKAALQDSYSIKSVIGHFVAGMDDAQNIMRPFFDGYVNVRDAATRLRFLPAQDGTIASVETIERSLKLGERAHRYKSQLRDIEKYLLGLANETITPAGCCERLSSEATIKAGRQPAVEHFERMDHYLHSFPPSFQRGLALTMVKFCRFNIETGARVDRATLDAIDGFVSIINLGKERQEGPTLSDFMRMVLEADEKHPWERAGKVLPNIPLFVFKKGYYAIQLQRQAAMRGEATSSTVYEELVKKQGITREFFTKIGKIFGKLTESTLGASRMLLIEKPLFALSAVEAKKQSNPIGGRIQRVLDGYFRMRARWVEERPAMFGGGTHAFERTHAEARPLARASLSEVIEHFIDRVGAFERGERGISFSALKQLSKYVHDREKLEALKARQRRLSLWCEASHYLEGELRPLLGILESPRRNDAPALADPVAPAKKQTVFYKIWQAGRMLKEAVIDRELERLSSLNAPAPAKPLVLQVTDKGQLVVWDTDGKFKRVNRPASMNLVWSGDADPESRMPAFSILHHADHARVVCAQYYLGIELTPQESNALLDAHHDHKRPLRDRVKNLIQAGFTIDQLFGVPGRPYRGLFRSGIIAIGDGTDAQIQALRTRL